MTTSDPLSSFHAKFKVGLKANHPNKLLGLYLGLAAIVIFLAIVSLSPKIGEQLGNLASKKDSQSTYAAVSSPCGQYGDVNGNGTVDATDSQQVLRYVGGLSTSISFTDEVKKRADVNGNLKVDTADSLLILNLVSGINFTFPVCVDHDTDGFTDAVENYIGTDPYKACGGTNAWPADFVSGGIPDSTNKITIQDIGSFMAPARRLDTSPGDVNYNKRWDIVPGKGIFAKDINIQDLNAVSLLNGKTCVLAAAPVLNFSATPATIETGKQVYISWTSTGTVAPCDASSNPGTGWRGQQKTSGSIYSTLTNAGTYTFTLTCYGPGGKTVKTAAVNAVSPCSGTPVLEVRPTTVEKGQNIVLFASGFSNCTSADVVKFESTSDGISWNKPLVNCNLANGNNCYGTFTADWTGSGPYSIRALLDIGGNGSIESSSPSLAYLTVTSPPPPCNGTPTVSLSASIVNPDSTVTATGSGVSSCSSLDTMHFYISADGFNWVGLSPYCNLASGSSCSSTSGVMYGLPVYEGGHIYKVKAVLQKSNGQSIDSAAKDLIVKIPNTWGGSKYPIDPNLPTGEEALANYYFARSEPEPDEPYSRGEPYGPFPTWDFMAGIPPLYMATNSNFFKQRDKFDLRVVDFMKKCGYKVQLSDRATDINQGIDAWLTIGGKEIPIDFKVMKAANVDAFTAYNMPRNNTEFDSNWRSSGNDKLPEDTRKAIAGKLGRGFKTVNDAGFIIPQALPILIDAVQTSERIANGAADEFHHNIDINKMNCMRLGEIIKKAQEVFKPELDSGKIAKSQQTTILEQAAMQRWGGPGYVPIPFTSSVNISSLSQIVPGKTNNLKLAEPDKGGGLFPNLDLNISRPSLSDVAKAAAGAATGGASTWVIVNGARAANGVGYAAGFAVGMTENTYNSLYCGYNAEENCQN